MDEWPWSDGKRSEDDWRLTSNALDDVRSWRGQLKISDSALAKQAGLDRGTVKAILAGDSARRRSFIRLIEALVKGLMSQDGVSPATSAWWRRAALPPPRKIPNNVPDREDWERLFGDPERVARVLRELADHRVVTLTGCGGVGKSTLALEVARAAKEGRWDAVHLVQIDDAALSKDGLVAAVCGALDTDRRRDQDLEAIRNVIVNDACLIVLDGCDRSKPSVVDLVAELEKRCRRVRFLVTAQSKLGLDRVQGTGARIEKDVRVRPLSTPNEGDGPETIREYDSVRLFLDRADSDDAGLEGELAAISELCRYFGGVPESIVVAAAWHPTTLWRTIREEGLPKGGKDDRHRVLFARSIDRLGASEREGLLRLSLFPGGFSSRIAYDALPEGMDAPTVLVSLYRQNLVQSAHARETDEERFRVLDPVREVATADLGSEAYAADAESRMARGLLAFIRQAEPYLGGPEDRWSPRVEREYRNLSAAMDLAGPSALGIAAALRRHWYARGFFSEGRRRIEAALAQDSAPESPDRAKALAGLGALLSVIGEWPRARRAAREGLRIARLGAPEAAAECCAALGAIAHRRGRLGLAKARFDESLDWYESADPAIRDWRTVRIMNNLAVMMIEGERFVEAESACVASRERAGDLRYTHGWAAASTNLAVAQFFQSLGLDGLERLAKLDEAQDVCDECLDVQSREYEPRPRAYTLINRGMIRTEQDRWAGASEDFLEAFDLLEGFGDTLAAGVAVGETGALASRAGDLVSALKLWAAADNLRPFQRLPRNERRRIETYIASAREAMGERDFSRHRSAGARMSGADAIKATREWCRSRL